ncbi:hypothetical protein [Flindersiella endophytica]
MTTRPCIVVGVDNTGSWPVRRIAANHGGDFRNPEPIAAWADQIAAELKRLEETNEDAQLQDRR